MKVGQMIWQSGSGWSEKLQALEGLTPQLALVFGEGSSLGDSRVLSVLKDRYPQAVIAGCSTSGEIEDVNVHDGAVVVTLVAFAHSSVKLTQCEVSSAAQSQQVGAQLASQLDKEGLVHVMTFSDGLSVNGTELAKGLREGLPPQVAVTGGLAGDGARFENTQVLLSDGALGKRVAAIGFYGSRLKVGYGSLGGWDSFGPVRSVTKSEGNVLYELDGQSALDLYKQYLGPHSEGLPASALLFPLSIQSAPGQPSLVRTVLSVDENAKSMTFAGDVPQGSQAQLMKANFDRLVDGAADAASHGRAALGDQSAELAILISCVGRKLVLKQRVEEEVEAVREVLGPQATLTGFYSYGEICPSGDFKPCELHNQTMTITTLAEA